MTKPSRSRFVVPATAVACGAIVVGLELRNDDRGSAVFAAVLFGCLTVLLVAGGRREWAVLFRGEGDERQTSI